MTNSTFSFSTICSSQLSIQLAVPLVSLCLHESPLITPFAAYVLVFPGPQTFYVFQGVWQTWVKYIFVIYFTVILI